MDVHVMSCETYVEPAESNERAVRGSDSKDVRAGDTVTRRRARAGETTQHFHVSYL